MNYPGSKAQAGVFQRIIGQMPPHAIYVEPFFGSGQIFHRKLRAPQNFLIDKSGSAIAKIDPEAGVSALVGDAISLLPKLPLTADSVIYCDPPYLLSTRSGRVYYEHEFSDHHHATLLTLLQELPGKILLSGYDSKLYGAALRNWRCIRYRTRTRGKTVTECLWCNFEEPDELHDWRFAGHNFRERCALRRLADRWRRRLVKMPARKRGYVMHAVHQPLV